MQQQRKIAVLGASSFSGQDFVDLLLDDPTNHVIGTGRSPQRGPEFCLWSGQDFGSRYRYIPIDMNHDMAGLLELLDAERPEWIVNFTALSEVAQSWENPDHWFQINCTAQSRLINHLRSATYLERYLHISTPEVYGTCAGNVDEDTAFNPSTPYAASKAATDMLLKAYRDQFDFPVVTVRATNVYGARQLLHKIIPRSILYTKTGRRIPLHGGGVAVKSFIHIRDVSRGELAILQSGQEGQIYHLAPDSGLQVREIVQAVCDRLGTDMGAVVEIVGERPGQDAAYVLDSSKARQEFGWAPLVGFSRGVDEVVQWVEQHWEVLRLAPWDYEHKA